MAKNVNNITVTVDDEKNKVPIIPEGMSLVPVLQQSRVVVFPYTLTPLVINGEENIEMVKQASKDERLLAVFPPLPTAEESEALAFDIKFNGVEFNGAMVSTIGVLVRIVKMLNFPDGTVRVLVRGLKRIKFEKEGPIRNGQHQALVSEINTEPEQSLEISAMIKNAINQFQEIISYTPNFPDELKIAILNLNNNVRISDLITDTLNIDFTEKLALLNLVSLNERLQLLTILLNREVEVLHLGSEIHNQVQTAMSKSQRDFFLREQLKTIKKELGEDNSNPDVVAIKKKIKELDLPEAVLKTIDKELERLELIPQAAAEYHMAYTYIDWLISIPWNIYSEDCIDVSAAAKILEKDHYGLADIKERILEFLAVLQLKKDRKAPIICFVGPPGVGKTSLGQSIARAMGREFIRMSLGGVRDEAEIRGHRRTYIGALPGRIIQGLKRAGTSNPLFMLDEIDKLGNDHRGDPASALLEVLDPQQNHAFNDHYLELDCDLSSIMFIATANVTDTIPPALRDRMEIIRLPGYTSEEKKQIAKRFLAPRQLKANGVKHRQLSFSVKAIDEIINHYTREAGVRSLERTIGKVCRKYARDLVEGKIKDADRTLLGVAEVKKYLGVQQFTIDKAETMPAPGTATGMAWTSVGGTILVVEASVMPGNGTLKLTGSLGNVMKESAEAAFSYIRSNATKFKLRKDTFTKNDFHIHVPDGATPKDGPSAGITIITALLSAMTGRNPTPELSMTGEITLRGRVTAVGGIKEKVIAAMRSGIKTIVLPDANRKDLEEIPDNIKNKLTFKFAENVKQALKYTLKK
jgi:ATP-dependent Lon protease